MRNNPMQHTSTSLYGQPSKPFFTVPVVILVLICLCASGFVILGRIEGQEWDFVDCVYFTVISLTTVGYGETLPNFESHVATRIYTMVVLVVGYTVMVWAASSLIAQIVEGRLGEAIARRKMMQEIEQMSGHYLICGLGDTGVHVFEELHRTKRACVLLDMDPDRIAAAIRECPAPFVAGDCETEETLRQAGIDRAAGFVACLSEDKDNVYLVLTARQLNPSLRIVARAVNPESIEKLRRAGADVVVSPNLIGGLRIASEMVRPTVTNFLDLMLRAKDAVIRIEEVEIPEHSPVEGKSIRDVNIRARTGLLILALTDPHGGGEFIYNPESDRELHPGMTLVVLGNVDDVVRLRDLVSR